MVLEDLGADTRARSRVLVPATNVKPRDASCGGHHMGRLALYRQHVSEILDDKARAFESELSR
jgi:hypothetical protein